MTNKLSLTPYLPHSLNPSLPHSRTPSLAHLPFALHWWHHLSALRNPFVHSYMWHDQQALFPPSPPLPHPSLTPSLPLTFPLLYIDDITYRLAKSSSWVNFQHTVIVWGESVDTPIRACHNLESWVVGHESWVMSHWVMIHGAWCQLVDIPSEPATFWGRFYSYASCMPHFMSHTCHESFAPLCESWVPTSGAKRCVCEESSGLCMWMSKSHKIISEKSKGHAKMSEKSKGHAVISVAQNDGWWVWGARSSMYVRSEEAYVCDDESCSTKW